MVEKFRNYSRLLWLYAFGRAVLLLALEPRISDGMFVTWSVIGVLVTLFLDWHLIHVINPWIDRLTETEAVQSLCYGIAVGLVYAIWFPVIIVIGGAVAYRLAKKLGCGLSQFTHPSSNDNSAHALPNTPPRPNIYLIEILAGHGAYGLHPMTQVLQIAF